MKIIKFTSLLSGICTLAKIGLVLKGALQRRDTGSPAVRSTPPAKQWEEQQEEGG